VHLYLLWVESNSSRKCSEYSNSAICAPSKIGFDVIRFLALETDLLALFYFKLCSLDTIPYLEVKLYEKHRVAYLAYNGERTYRKCNVELGGG